MEQPEASSESPDLSGRWWILVALVPSLFLVKSLWFSASAVVPQLTEEFGLTRSAQSFLTISVQLGFVVFALVSAVTNLADRMSGPRLIAVCAMLGALFNLVIPLFSPGFSGIIVMRFLTGATMAGAYPPAMKLLSTWFRHGRGMAIGFLVAALTAGSAMPHLFNSISLTGVVGHPGWRPVLYSTSACAAVGSLIAWFFLRDGPLLVQARKFDWGYAAKIFTDRPLRLANFGYLGHQWELYAVWAWGPLFLRAAYLEVGWGASWAALAGFGMIAVGALGSIGMGLFADRRGRTLSAGLSLAISGACCVLVGVFFNSPVVLTVICLIWGVFVVSDSAQFSAAVSELCDARYVGTALTMQTCSGFLVTIPGIFLIPHIVELVGWRWAFLGLVPGPMFGLLGMIRLRRMAESLKLAGGRR